MGKEFDLNNLNRPASGNEALEKRTPPCAGHNKESENLSNNELLKERLDFIKKKHNIYYDSNDTIQPDKNNNSDVRVFQSGAKRDSNSNKPFIHNLKGYTRRRFGYHMNLGSSKYGDGNWLKGMPTDQYLESVDRHLAAYMEGDRSEDHLSAIIFGIQGCMLNEKINDNISDDHYFKMLKK